MYVSKPANLKTGHSRNTTPQNPRTQQSEDTQTGLKTFKSGRQDWNSCSNILSFLTPLSTSECVVGFRAEGFRLGVPLTPEEMSRYKYNIVADDLVGTTGMCEALPRGQTILRQASPFRQFFDAMLLPGVHYVQADHK